MRTTQSKSGNKDNNDKGFSGKGVVVPIFRATNLPFASENFHGEKLPNGLEILIPRICRSAIAVDNSAYQE